MKIGVLGAGPWGRNHIRNYSQLGHKVVACDLNKGLLESAAKDFGCGITSDYKELLSDASVFAVSICTPASTHYKFAKEFLSAGKHALVEKPLAMDAKEASELVKLAASKKLVLMAGHVYRFDPGVNKAREMVANGELGKVYYIYNELAGLKQPRSDCGVLHNYAVHEFDIMSYVLGEYPSEATCFASFPLGREKFEDFAATCLRFPSGAAGLTQVSWLPAGKWRDIWVVGEKKTIYIDTEKFIIKVFESGISPRGGILEISKGPEREIQLEKAEPLARELSHFISCIEGKSKCVAGGEVGARIAAVIDACEVSMRERRAVGVKYV